MNFRFFRFVVREPAATLAFVAAVVKLSSAFWWHATVAEQATVNTAVAAAVGLLIAVVAHDAVGPALINMAQAVLAAAVGFGLQWSADRQAAALTVITLAVGMWTRDQVTAKVSASYQRVPSPRQSP